MVRFDRCPNKLFIKIFYSDKHDVLVLPQTDASAIYADSSAR